MTSDAPFWLPGFAQIRSPNHNNFSNRYGNIIQYWKQHHERNHPTLAGTNPESQPVIQPPLKAWEIKPDQKAHLLDWRLVISTRPHLRSLGKESFFSHKVFSLEPDQAMTIQKSQLPFLTQETQQIAVQRIKSIIFIISNPSPPSSFLTLSSCISKFRHLKQLDQMFGYRRGEPADFLVRAYKCRRRAWEHFIDVMALSGVRTEGLDVVVLICTGATWEGVEGAIRSQVYLVLIVTCDLNARSGSKVKAIHWASASDLGWIRLLRVSLTM